MNSLIKTGLIVGGLAFLFKDQIFGSSDSGGTAPAPAAPKPGAPAPSGSSGGTAPPPAASGSTGGSSSGSSGSSSGAAAHPLSYAKQIEARTGAGARLSADQWNWYWSDVSGVQQTADLFPPDNRGALMTFEEYFSRRAAAGLSGLVSLGRIR